MGQTKAQRMIKQLSGVSTVQKQTPIASDMFLPNHSGDHQAGRMNRTPTNDLDLVNKEYVDDNIPTNYLKDDAADIGVGLQLTQDNSTADTQFTPQVLYNTDATPPAASGFPIGTIYVQYTA